MKTVWNKYSIYIHKTVYKIITWLFKIVYKLYIVEIPFIYINNRWKQIYIHNSSWKQIYIYNRWKQFVYI